MSSSGSGSSSRRGGGSSGSQHPHPHPQQQQQTLSEEYIQDSFHSYLKSSLTQAKVERLLDADLLASAEADLMITGPALCLYFAALRCTTDPPSVPLPRLSKSPSSPSSHPTDLSPQNCPAPFIPFLLVWSHTVLPIQHLPPEAQHDLARAICGLHPLLPPGMEVSRRVRGLAEDLRAVAIEISQRRSFQRRYADDLQAALDAGVSGGGGGNSRSGTGSGLSVGAAGSPRKASFVPPPEYAPSPISAVADMELPNPHEHAHPLPPPPPFADVPPQSAGLLSPFPTSKLNAPLPPTPTRPVPSPSPSILTPTTPAIELIRETLYAALADSLSSHPSLLTLLRSPSRDRTRAYFACVASAILRVATTSLTPSGGVRGVLGAELTLDACPEELRPFMRELAGIGRQAREMEERDDEDAIWRAQRGLGDDAIREEGEGEGVGRMERVRRILERGVGYDRVRGADGREAQEGEGGRRSVEGRAVAFANRINALALGMTRLPAFRERQEDVFRVLEGVAGGS